MVEKLHSQCSYQWFVVKSEGHNLVGCLDDKKGFMLIKSLYDIDLGKV